MLLVTPYSAKSEPVISFSVLRYNKDKGTAAIVLVQWSLNQFLTKSN